MWYYNYGVVVGGLVVGVEWEPMIVVHIRLENMCSYIVCIATVMKKYVVKPSSIDTSNHFGREDWKIIIP